MTLIIGAINNYNQEINELIKNLKEIIIFDNN